MNKMTVLGLMSGTSLDGLDLALCEFEQQEEKTLFKILKAHTYEYTDAWKRDLSEAAGLGAEGYFALHARYGSYLAEAVNEFMTGTSPRPAAIASHGHTIFHQPGLGFSTQLGCGATIAAHTGLVTVCDFRSLDVALGGQGAPLVPVGDKHLFARYAACLNLGGIANISYDTSRGQRVAYDVCEVNMLLNHLALKAGQPYDAGGNMARSGTVHDPLLQLLNRQEFYAQRGARSLGREWFEREVLPLTEHLSMPVNDLLATATEHVADVLAYELNEQQHANVLVTGGGVFNTFLMDRIRAKTATSLIVPEAGLVNFKEALIFAFLGYLRLQEKVNTLQTVTGASGDSIGGAVYTIQR